MTEKVFWSDPYRQQLTARIAAMNGDAIELDRTIFFAASGGQESDAGTIAGREVLEAHWNEGKISYQLVTTAGLQPGDEVEIRIDWPRRLRLMRLHFAAELLLELCYQSLPGVEKLGAHIAADKARIDFRWPQSLAGELLRLQQQAEALITADLPITSAFSDLVNERRYWEIHGFARVPCGGTHLRRTGEIGPLRIKRVNPGQGKERLEIYLA